MIFTTNFDTVFEELLNGSLSPTKSVRNYITDKDENGYTLRMAVPGMVKKDISVEVDRSLNEIIITAEEGNDFVNDFTRRFKIGNSINVSEISAEVENGILTLVLPFNEDQSTVKIL